jgi:hypothetical protein
MRKHHTQLVTHAKALAVGRIFYEAPDFDQLVSTLLAPEPEDDFITPCKAYENLSYQHLAEILEREFDTILEDLEYAYDLAQT